MLAGISVYVPACRQRKFIEGLVAEHGGCTTRKWSPAVLSVKPDEAGASEARLWCVSDFKRYLDSGGHWTPGDKDAERPNHKASPGSQIRQAYTRDEDRKMIDFATSHETLSATGKLLWQEAERLKITSHTWQSMQTRWRKVLKHRVAPSTALGNRLEPQREPQRSASKRKRPTPDPDRKVDNPTVACEVESPIVTKQQLVQTAPAARSDEERRKVRQLARLRQQQLMEEFGLTHTTAREAILKHGGHYSQAREALAAEALRVTPAAAQRDLHEL